MRSSKLFALFFLVSSSYAHLNEVYSDFLSGREELTEEMSYRMYLDFLKEYKLTPKGRQQVEWLQTKDSSKNRFEVFDEHVKAIISHNTDSTKTYKKGINAFTDFTFEEFSAYYNLNEAQDKCSATHGLNDLKRELIPLEEIPEFYDWRENNGVTSVKDQGSCGSCWTFSTVGSLEGHYLIQHGEVLDLAEQQLVDCAGAYDNYGCSGGLPSHAFQYIHDNGGITTQLHYPYTAKDGVCDEDVQLRATTGGSVNITVNDEVELLQELFDKGPISIAFQVYSDFHDYSSGVYTSSECGTGPEDVNHAVVAVGFGTDEETGMDYWIVKNSWSEDWGMDGYFLMERGKNICGVAQCNSYPFNVQPATQTAFLQ